MATNDTFMVELMAALNRKGSQKQINTDIKQLEKTINNLKLTATLLKGDSKRQIKEALTSMQSQLAPIKLQAKLDAKAAQRSINDALENVSIKDIRVNEHGLKLKIQKALLSAQSAVTKIPISVDYQYKKDKLQNNLTTFLGKNSKIRESSALLKEADSLRHLFDGIKDKKSLAEASDALTLFKSEVQATGFAGLSTTDKLKNMVSKITQIGTLFGVGAMAVRQFSNSLKTLKGNSTILTEIAKTSEMSAKQIKEIGDNSFLIASKYGVRSNGYLEGVREMARSGYDSLSKELGELSVLAQSAGDMTADSANNYLLATDAAYKYKGSIEQLTAALDGANYISNRNSATLTDIADGVRVSASYASEAGVQIDELTAAEATMIATTKRSGSEMGRAFRSILLNLQQVSGEFDGEVIDAESLKKVEDRCHSLGIELETLTAEGAKLRNPMEVLKELAQVYNSLPDSSVDKQGIISDIGGKYHANALAALLSRWDLYEKMLGEFSQGAGSALAEAAKTADSWEGRLNALQNQWDSFVNHITSQGLIKGGISSLDATIAGAETLVDTLGALPTLLTAVTGAYTALNKDYGITQILNPQNGKLDLQGSFMGVNITNIKAQKKHFEEAAEAIAEWNIAVGIGQTDVDKLGESVVKNNVQLKNYLSTCTDGTASLAGYQASLRAAGVQTDALRLKTVLMTSAMSFGLGLAIQTGISLISKFVDEQIHAQERALEAASEASSRVKSLNDSYKSHKNVVEETLSAYQKLSKGVDIASNKNISLSDEDYKSYLDIINHLAETFPTLVKTMDENGNAILTLGQNGRTASEDLAQLLKAEEDLNNYKISQDIDDLFGGVKVKIDEANKAVQSYKDSLVGVEGQLKAIQTIVDDKGDLFKEDNIKLSGNYNDDTGKAYYDSLVKAIQSFYDSLDGSEKVKLGDSFDLSKMIQFDAESGAYDIYINSVLLSEEQKKQLQNEIKNQAAEIAPMLTDAVGENLKKQKSKMQEAELAWKDFLPSLVSTMKSKASFQELDADMQSFATDMVSNLMMGVVESDAWDSEDPYAYVRKNVILPLTQLNEEDKGAIREAYSKLLKLDPDNLSEQNQRAIDTLIQSIANRLGQDDTNALKINLGFNVDPDLQSKYDQAILSAAQKFEKTSTRDIDSLQADLAQFFEQNSINTQKEIEDWNKIIKSCSTATEAKEKYLRLEIPEQSELSYADTIKELEGMKESFSALDSAYSKFVAKDKNIGFEDLQGLSKQFKDISGIENYVRAIQEAKGSTEETQKAFDGLLTSYLEQTGILDMINEKNAQLIASYLEEQGVTNANAIVQDALTHSLEMVAAQKYYVANASFDLANATESEIASFINEAGNAGIARSAIIELMMAKIDCNATGIVTDGDIQNLINLANAAGIAEAAVRNAKAAQAQKNAPGVVRSAGAQSAIENNNDRLANSLKDGIKEDLYKPKKYSYSGGGASNSARGAGSRGGGNSGSKKEKEPLKKQFDWIQTVLDAVERKRQKVADIIDDENTSYERQLSLMNELLANDEQVIQENKDALDNYLSQWEAIRQKILEVFGETEGNKLIGKIMMGDTSIEGWKDEYSYSPDDKDMAAKMELLEDAQKVFAEYTKQDERYKDKIKEHTEDIKKQFEIRINYIKETLQELESKMGQIESELSLKEITGRIITESDYRNMINLAEDQIDAQYDQIDALEEYLDELEEGSAEWYNVKAQISSCKDAIRQCEENQAKWNEEILNLPVRRIERYLELLGFIKQDLNNFIDEQSSWGKDTTQEQLQKLIELSSKQIEKLKEEHEELVKRLSNYDYGTDNFNEVQKNIQDCENEMSALIQEQIQYNKQILDIPINKITEFKEQLTSIKDALDGVTDDYDTAISAVITTIDKEIDKYDDMKEAAEKSYESRIKPLQDELDLLNKNNEARQIQLGVEQSLYDLERAKNQKTTQVVENGEIVYKEDIDALRNANIAHEDALYDKAKHDLEQQISSLEEERDALLESYDGQIDKLNEIKDRWSEIADNIRNANEATLANKIFGSGWEDKITSGADKDIYDAMVKNYETIEAQKEMYQKQIDATEKVSSLMEQYIAAFQDGSMSYQDVLAQFNELILAAKDGFLSQEYLETLLNATGNQDTVSALENIQNQMSGSYDDFKSYLQSVQVNNEMISKYTSTWEEIKKTLEEQLATLKRMAEEEAKKVSNSKPSSGKGNSGGKGHSSSNGPDWNTPDGPATGPAKEIEERERAKISHKDGLESSPIGHSISPNTDFIKEFGTRKLSPEEVAAILHTGEIVMNPEQINQMQENMRSLVPITSYEIPRANLDHIPKVTNVEVNMGGMTLNNVDNGQKVIDQIMMNFPSVMRQQASRWRW